MSSSFDAEAYWKDKPYKCWVVCLTRIIKRREQRTFYNVQSSTAEKAINTAKRYCLWKGKVYGSARLAGPNDLGATERKNPETGEWESLLNISSDKIGDRQ